MIDTNYGAGYEYQNLVTGSIENVAFASAVTNGTLQCVTVDLEREYNLDELGLWLYWKDARKHYYNTLSVGRTDNGGTNHLETILHEYSGTDGYIETSQGRRYNAWNNDAIIED